MKKFLAFISSSALLLLPALTFGQAAGAGGFSSIDQALTTVNDFINRLIPFMIGVALLVFIIGLIRYVTAGGDPEKQKEARNTIIWGIVILFVMVSVWGLVNILTNTFGTAGAAAPAAPKGPTV